MNSIIKILFLLLITVKGYSQECNAYRFDVKIDVASKSLKADGSIVIDFQGQDSINLVLWKKTAIHSISVNDAPLVYRFDTVSPSPQSFIPKGTNLIIYNSSKKIGDQIVAFSYTCDMRDAEDWANSFSEEWIEINLYCAWFPVNLNSQNITSQFNIVIDEGYKVTGSGIITTKDGHWEMIQPWKGFDNVIIASNDLRARVLHEKDCKIEIDFVGQNETIADSVITECKYAFELYQKIFGIKDSAYFKFIIAPFSDGGGYSRKNFVSWRTNNFDMNTIRGIGHELAHFWWNNANPTIWEDWLNESFAEYSMLVYLRDRFGNEVFNQKIEEYKKSTIGTPPIWGMLRNAPKSREALYHKGSLILYEFELKVGGDQFFAFMKEIACKKINTTCELLKLVDTNFSKEMCLWLENKLKTE